VSPSEEAEPNWRDNLWNANPLHLSLFLPLTSSRRVGHGIELAGGTSRISGDS
jgi:hypothetical protein